MFPPHALTTGTQVMYPSEKSHILKGNLSRLNPQFMTHFPLRSTLYSHDTTLQIRPEFAVDVEGV
jgi:hypothetical protein